MVMSLDVVHKQLGCHQNVEIVPINSTVLSLGQARAHSVHGEELTRLILESVLASSLRPWSERSSYKSPAFSLPKFSMPISFFMAHKT